MKLIIIGTIILGYNIGGFMIFIGVTTTFQVNGIDYSLSI